MIKGLMTSEAAMRPKMAQLEVIANNLANINSTGFKRDRLFVQVLKDSINGQSNGGGDLATGTVKYYTDFSDGSLQPTGNTFDLAIQGRGFFVVDTPRGVRYTRNGNFSLSTDGTLVDSTGSPVMGVDGKIQIPDPQKLQQGTITIAEDGEVTADKQALGTLRIADFQNPEALRKESGSYFAAAPGQQEVEGPGKLTAIRQGYLEESNVDGLEEMVGMIELSRSYETDQKVIQAQDESIEKGLDVGKL